MALNLSKDYTFAPNTTIASAEVNTNFDELYNAFSGLEAGTSTLAVLKMDADPTAALYVATKQYVDAYANYKRPQLTYVSATTIDVSVNTGTANTTKILFPDGNYRSVTEDTSSSNKYRRMDITADAEFTSGTEESGLRAALTEANNTWYAIYAVKSLINTANFVLVGDTTMPVIGSVSTLNSAYGTNGWVYLGLIRNGDRNGSPGDILNFIQVGNVTIFRNEGAGAVDSMNGYIVANTASASTISFTYSAGSGALDIPDNVTMLQYGISTSAPGAQLDISAQTSATMRFLRINDTPGTTTHSIPFKPATLGCALTSSSATASSIFLQGFMDSTLGVGANPFI